MNKVVLSERLALIAGLVPRGTRVADVGTDHGYMPVYLLQNYIADSVIATDIKIGPLNMAQIIAKKYGYERNIKFVLCDGLAGLEENEVDTIIIAGMGGETIINILSAATWTNRNKHLILQPQSKQPLLRRWLIENDYFINEEYLVCDSGKIYTVFTAEGGFSQPYTIAQLYVGKIDNHRSMDLLSEYLASSIHQVEKIYNALELSERPEDRLRLEEYSEVLTGMLDMKGSLENEHNK